MGNPPPGRRNFAILVTLLRPCRFTPTGAYVNILNNDTCALGRAHRPPRRSPCKILTPFQGITDDDMKDIDIKILDPRLGTALGTGTDWCWATWWA